MWQITICTGKLGQEKFLDPGNLTDPRWNSQSLQLSKYESNYNPRLHPKQTFFPVKGSLPITQHFTEIC